MEKHLFSLQQIADMLQFASNGTEQFIHIFTGEELYFSEYFDTSEEINEMKKRLACEEGFVRLPTSFDIDEYQVMVDFAESLQNNHIQSCLVYCLDHAKPSRHFKDTLCQYQIEEAYYDFLNEHLLEVAQEWCSENNITLK